MKGIVITVGGLHGTGKTTYARSLSTDLGYRHVSAGDLFRMMAEAKGLTLDELNRLAESDPAVDKEIDQRIKDEAARGGVVLDGQLAAWMAEDADLKILLIAPRDVRIARIAQREQISLQEAEESTLAREGMERERYMRLYGIDVADPSVYDLIVDTNLYPLEEMTQILKRIVSDYIRQLMVSGGRKRGCA
ncbi:MAG: AAA family ATPase [Candidatus Bathyarchaeia archaeon]